jgi:hypothetical protein
MSLPLGSTNDLFEFQAIALGSWTMLYMAGCGV